MDPYVHSTTTEAIGSTTGKDLLQAGPEFTPQIFSRKSGAGGYARRKHHRRDQKVVERPKVERQLASQV